MDFPTVLSVYQLTRYVKSRLEGDPVLRDVWVRGELSNCRCPSSGHMYFTLKDDRAQVNCVMFRSDNRRLRFRPENGMQVIAGGQLGVYERAGTYQLYVRELHPVGVGALHLAFEQLKAKLAAEGLFDAARKRPLPLLPRRVGIVTSPTGAAIRDIIRVTRRRFPNLTLVLAPVPVQGDGAAEQIVAAIRRLNEHGNVDVIIVGRGGGAAEDLWAFNDERVARAVYASRIPVVSAVGHETDYTIIDFVADVRAPTPSAAAELVVPSRSQLVGAVTTMRQRLVRAIQGRLRAARNQYERLVGRPALRRPADRIRQERQHLDETLRRLHGAAVRRLEQRRERLRGLCGRLDALSPLAILERGYGLVQRRADGRIVRRAVQVQPGDAIDVRLVDGILGCRVAEVTAGPAITRHGSERGST